MRLTPSKGILHQLEELVELFPADIIGQHSFAMWKGLYGIYSLVSLVVYVHQLVHYSGHTTISRTEYTTSSSVDIL